MNKNMQECGKNQTSGLCNGCQFCHQEKECPYKQSDLVHPENCSYCHTQAPQQRNVNSLTELLEEQTPESTSIPSAWEPSWEERFRSEFGIHFKNSPDELGFAIAFIEEELQKAKEESRKTPDYETYNEGFEFGKKQTLASLREKIEGMRITGEDEYNQAVDDIIKLIDEQKQ